MYSYFKTSGLVLCLIPGMPAFSADSKILCNFLNMTPCTERPTSPRETMRYSFDGRSLQIERQNLYSNCATTGYTFKVEATGNKVTIREEPLLTGYAGCNCFFTINYVLTGLKPGEYDFEFIPNTLLPSAPNEPKLLGRLDLRFPVKGEVAINRYEPPPSSPDK